MAEGHRLMLASEGPLTEKQTLNLDESAAIADPKEAP